MGSNSIKEIGKRTLIYFYTRCQICHDLYNFNELNQDLSKYIDIDISDIFDSSAIKIQIKMKICGKCRIEHMPCRGCYRCDPLNRGAICEGCFLYGFNNPASTSGKCPDCSSQVYQEHILG